MKLMNGIIRLAVESVRIGPKLVRVDSFNRAMRKLLVLCTRRGIAFA